MSSSLFAGVSGLRAHQEMLDVVGNNLANLDTTGFKSQQVEFGDLLYQTLSQATSGSGGNGGTNPLQVGFGVSTVAINSNQQQGSLQATGNDLDLALEGNGFFVVNNGVQNFYTRSGSFGVDANGFMVDPGTGSRVQRFGTVGEGTATSPAFQVPGDNSIKLPGGTGIPGQATVSVTLQGNLSAAAVGPLQTTLTSAAPFQTSGGPATNATLLNALTDNTTPYVNGDVIDIQGTNNGATVNTTLAVNATSTLGDVVNAITAAFPGATAKLDSSGNLILQANQSGPDNLSVTLSDGASNTGKMNWSNHVLNQTVAGKVGDTVNSTIQIFDVQGTAHNLSVTFQKQAANTWNLTASIPAADGTMVNSTITGITFNDDGSFRQINGANQNISFTVKGLSAAQTVKFSFGSANGFNGLTQFGSASSAAATSQDGFAAGFLTNISISQSGLVNGVFTNGRTLAIAQLAIANFSNAQGLNREGNNYYSLSSHSGDPLIGEGVSGGRGNVKQGSLESSNVDVALEFTQLITAQRGYQVNARTITISDQILQSLAQIIQ